MLMEAAGVAHVRPPDVGRHPPAEEVHHLDREAEPAFLKPLRELADLRDEGLVLAPVRGIVAVAELLHILLFGREVILGVGGKVREHLPEDFLSSLFQHRVVKGVDERYEPLVLTVNLADADGEVVGPLHECHTKGW